MTQLSVEEVPVDQRGQPDLRSFRKNAEHYNTLYLQWLQHRSSDPKLAFAERVQGQWGLIAQGAGAIPYAMAMLRSSTPDVREDAAGILEYLGRNAEILGALAEALRTESDPQAKDSILLALGSTRSPECIPVIAGVILDPKVDGDTAFTATAALAKIIRRNFLGESDPIGAAKAWLRAHGWDRTDD
jgi:hypothetical protein